MTKCDLCKKDEDKTFKSGPIELRFNIGTQPVVGYLEGYSGYFCSECVEGIAKALLDVVSMIQRGRGEG